ncbi:hypothetical protein GCM10007904_35640 [Oharaeibacter diazotrophicus]|nr:hypothetical protein GCM10007904_35640 [Oharaeibacter diazotrophicus]
MVGLAGGLLAAGVAGSARANENDEPVGVVGDAEGAAFARRQSTRRLEVRSSILLGDLVWTAARSRAALDLDGGTRINLGPKARLRIDRFVAAAGGTLELGEGALVFDRPDDLPKLDLQVRTTFGLIGVRGTRFFAGPSRGSFGVFVARGSVRVYTGGAERVLEAGDGVDIPARFARPSPVKKWGAARVDEAFASVLG